MINGVGSTTLMELYIVLRRVAQRPRRAGHRSSARSLVGRVPDRAGDGRLPDVRRAHGRRAARAVGRALRHARRSRRLSDGRRQTRMTDTTTIWSRMLRARGARMRANQASCSPRSTRTAATATTARPWSAPWISSRRRARRRRRPPIGRAPAAGRGLGDHGRRRRRHGPAVRLVLHGDGAEAAGATSPRRRRPWPRSSRPAWPACEKHTRARGRRQDDDRRAGARGARRCARRPTAGGSPRRPRSSAPPRRPRRAPSRPRARRPASAGPRTSARRASATRTRAPPRSPSSFEDSRRSDDTMADADRIQGGDGQGLRHRRARRRPRLLPQGLAPTSTGA